MEQLNRSELIARETRKYNKLHSENVKYGGRSARGKMFVNNEDQFHKLVKKVFKESKTMLDVGCGKGFFIDFFSARYKNLQITGMDISNEAAKTRPDLNIVVADGCNMPFDDNQFEVSVHMDGMEHIPAEIETDFLKEVLRVTKNYIYLTIATHAVKHHDEPYEAAGLGAVHINMKKADEWYLWLKEFSNNNNCVITSFQDYGLWCHCLLEVK